jgi:hypothetical protein
MVYGCDMMTVKSRALVGFATGDRLAVNPAEERSVRMIWRTYNSNITSRITRYRPAITANVIPIAMAVRRAN